MRGIYKFLVDCGRHGELTGVFSCEKEELEGIIGQRITFSDVLGKHSEFNVILEWTHLTEVTNDKKFVELFDLYQVSTGINPLDYFED
jgi:hypothetical protein